MSMHNTVFLLYGGVSSEHDVSVLSARSVVENIYYEYHDLVPVYITKQGRFLSGASLTAPLPDSTSLYLEEGSTPQWRQAKTSVGVPLDWRRLQADNVIVFPMLHGTNGEDGTIQGWLETVGVPYVGNGVRASASAMDKIISKQIFADADLPQVPYEWIDDTAWKMQAAQTDFLNRVKGGLLYPLYVKPANAGSSIGITRVTEDAKLADAIDFAFHYDDRILVEQGVPNAREIELALLGNRDDLNMSVPGEIGKTRSFYDFNAKFVEGQTKLIIPAKLPEETTSQLEKIAQTAFMELSAAGLCRIDFFVSDGGDVYINEVQTMPGFTQYSMYPYLWQYTGINYGDLLEELMTLGQKQFDHRRNIEKNY